VIIIIFLQKSGNKYIFAISVLLSTKISFFRLFTSFAPSAYWHSHPHIEPKHGFDWGRATGVMSNEIG